MHKFYFKAFAATAAGAVCIVFLGLLAGFALSGRSSGSVPDPEQVATTTAAAEIPAETPETGDQEAQELPEIQEIPEIHEIPTEIKEIDETQTHQEETAAPQEKTTNGIQIPGYDRIYFKAGTREQAITLSNPEGNRCFFVITLCLPDGSEFYRSDMLKPGGSISRIQATKDIPAGTYEGCIMRYDCYDLETMAALNGANNYFDLEVK